MKKPSIVERSKGYYHWYSFKFKRLVILNVHDVKNQSINEQERAFSEICVYSILYLHKKQQKCDSKVRTYHCSTCIEYMYQVHQPLPELYRQCCADLIECNVEHQK